MSPTDRSYALGKYLLGWTFVAAVAILLIWFAWDFLLLTFTGLLLAVLLRTCTDWVVKRTGLSQRWAFAVLIAGLLGGASLIGLLLAGRIASEASRMAELIPQSIATLRDSLETSSWGRSLVLLVQKTAESLRIEEKVGEFASGIFEALAGLIVVLAVGFFFALDEDIYKSGILRLFPAHHREHARIVVSDIEYTLRWWLIGQLVPMTILGVATYIGLLLLGVPLAFALSLLTGLLIFIPYVGALASEIPALLVALTQGPFKAVEVLILYLGLHIVEGYILTPIVQRRAVRLPPVVTILSQALMWTLAGFLGIALATPLAAVGLVLVKHLYLEEHPPERSGR